MDILPSGNIFRELQDVHDTGYFSSQGSIEDQWHQVNRIITMYMGRCIWVDVHGMLWMWVWMSEMCVRPIRPKLNLLPSDPRNSAVVGSSSVGATLIGRWSSASSSVDGFRRGSGLESDMIYVRVFGPTSILSLYHQLRTQCEFNSRPVLSVYGIRSRSAAC